MLRVRFALVFPVQCSVFRSEINKQKSNEKGTKLHVLRQITVQVVRKSCRSSRGRVVKAMD